VFATGGNGKYSSHPFKKKKINPKNRHSQMLRHLIFSSFTPFVPKQDKAKNTTAKKCIRILSTRKDTIRLKKDHSQQKIC
jgi:hypothetical protein